MIKTDDPSFAKDEASGAVLNTNNSALLAYKARKQQAAKIKSLEQRLAQMENLLRSALSEKSK